MKTCRKCKDEKSLSEFSVQKSTKDGLKNYCKSCVRVCSSEWRKQNAEKAFLARKKWRESNRESAALHTKTYKKRNREKFSSIYRNRRAVKNSAEGRHTAADVIAIFSKQIGLCANCKTRLFRSGRKKYHVDHIMPLALGGSNWPSNLQCLCPDCNLKKNAKDPIKWANENGRLL